MEACGKFSNLTLTMILYNVSCFWHSPIRAWRVNPSFKSLATYGKRMFCKHWHSYSFKSSHFFFFLLESSYDQGYDRYVHSVVMQDLKTGFLKSIKMFHVEVQMLRNFPTPYHCFSLCNKFMYSYTQN